MNDKGYMNAEKKLHEKMGKSDQKPTLILGGTGKTGRRVAQRLSSLGLPVRIGSKLGKPSFDWNKQESWKPLL